MNNSAADMSILIPGQSSNSTLKYGGRSLAFVLLAFMASSDSFAAAAGATKSAGDFDEFESGQAGPLVREQQEEKSKPAPKGPAEQRAKEERQAERDRKMDEALAKNPADPRAQHDGSRYQMERGNMAKAESLAQNALALARPDGNPKLTSRLLVTRGLLRYIRRDYRGAHEDGKAALEHDPNNWPAFELFMYSLDKWPAGMKSAAARQAGLMAGGTPKDADVTRRPSYGALRGPLDLSAEESADHERVARLIALQTPGIPRSPEEWVTRQKADPSPAFGLLTQAKNALAAGSLDTALQLAEDAVKADPSDPMVYAQRGLILSRMGDSNGAVLDLSKVIAKGWKWALAFRLRADALFKAGKWKAALADAELAVRLDPSDADAYFIRAMARAKLGGDPALVLADLERAADLKPAFAPFRDKAREKLGKEPGR